MRKTGSLFAAAAVMMMLWEGAAFAVDTKTTLGVKAWFSSWEETYPTGSVEYDGVWMIGPTVDVELENKMFLKGSLLFAVSDYQDTYFSAPFVGKETIRSRTDLDLMAGYMFTPQFGAFVAYKSNTSDFTDEWPIGTVNFTTDIKIKGPGVGVLGNIPVSESVTLYGSLSWMFLDIKSTLSSEDMDGPSFELGVAFSTSSNTAINVGYKSEKFSGSFSDGSGSFDQTFAGLTAGFKYTF
ncbi:MAG: outer membrane beta-barrel protein [Nitrospirota bacterium]